MIASILSIREEYPGVKTFVFDYRPSFRPGQFVMLSAMIGQENVSRAYSISSSPLDPNVELTIELVKGGKMTTHLFELQPGDQIEIGEPKGSFIYEPDIAVANMLTGGTGISAMRSIIRYCTQKGLATSLNLLYSNRTRDRILFREELESLAKKNQNLKIVHTLTRESPIGWTGDVGRIDKEKIAKYCDLKGNFFLCGSAEMAKELTSSLIDLGINKKDIKRDIWG
jgi:glycine betaine catabolism B